MSCPASSARSISRHHRLVEPDDAGEAVLPGAHPREQVLSDLLLDRAVDVAARPQLAQVWPADRAKRLRWDDRCSAAPFRHYVGLPCVRILRRSAAGANVRCCGIYFPARAVRRHRRGPRAAERRRSRLPRCSTRGCCPSWRAARSTSNARTSSAPGRSRSAARTPGSPGCPTRNGPAAWWRPAPGNHAQGVAFAAGLLGAAATVVMPERARRRRRWRRPVGYGASVTLHGASVEDALEEALRFAAQDRRRGSSTRSTTRTSWPARARSGSRSSSSARRCGRSSSRSAAAGWRRAMTVAVQSLDPEVQVVGVQAAAVPGLVASMAAGAPGAGRRRADDGRRDRGAAAGRHPVRASWPRPADRMVAVSEAALARGAAALP